MSLSPREAPARPEARDATCPERGESRRDGLDGLLRDLGSQVQRGSRALVRDHGPRLATGLPDLDALIGGGLPGGRLAEIAGPDGSGRTSLALALLARATRAGETVAWIDLAEALDAESARAAGAVLERVLWARPPGLREALRCSECLLDAQGFALVVLDLAERAEAVPTLPLSNWQRLARRAASRDTALLVLSRSRATANTGDLVLEMQSPHAHFTDGPALLEGLSIRARVARHRTGPAERMVSVRLSADTRAA